MFAVIKDWFRTYFSDEEAVYLFLALLGGFLIVAFMGRMLAPVMAAIVLAYLMQGLINNLIRHGMKRTVALYLVFALFVTLLLVCLILLLPMVWKQTLTLLHDQLPKLLGSTESWLTELPKSYPEVVSMSQVEQIVGAIREMMAEAGQSALTMSLASIPGLVQAMIFIVLVPLLVFFFLKDREKLIAWLLRLLPARRHALAQVWKEMDQQIANYVRGKAVEILLVGASSFVCFYSFGLHYAVLLSVLVGLSVVVPYIGATVVTLPVAAVGWVQFGWSSDFALVMVVYGIIQFIDGNILVPLLFSEAVNLHPVAIIVAILVFGGMWGFWGVFFAIPLATLLKAVLDAWPQWRQTAEAARQEA